MPGEEILLLGAAGAAVVIVAKGQPAPMPSTKSASGGTIVQGATTPGSSVKLGARVNMILGGRPHVAGGGTYQPGIHVTSIAPSPVSNSAAPASDPQLNAKLAEIEQAASKAFDGLSADAKQKGAAALNSSLDLHPPLTGDEDWQTVETVVGSSAGAAAGAAIAGPIGAKVGALVGAYLGVQLGDLLSKNWDDLKGYLDSAWSSVSDYASDAANSAEQAASDAADAAKDYIGGLL
jgi:hypothetical protein